jgi:predicted amidohydrolase
LSGVAVEPVEHLKREPSTGENHGYVVSRTLSGYVRDQGGTIIVEVYELTYQDGATERQVITWESKPDRADWLERQLQLEREDRERNLVEHIKKETS